MSQGGNQTLRVLLLEDRLPDAERIRNALVGAFPTCEVVHAQSGESFEAALAAGRFDLILSTYCAPDLRGLKALETARALGPDTPIVYVSDVKDAKDASAALEAIRQGAADFVVKQELDRLGTSVERAVTQAASHRQLQSRDARQHAQEDFVSRISHDLRTPLTAIKASIGVILANEPPGTSEPLHRMFRNIDLASDQMAEMVANLAELARLNAGFTQLRETACDLRDVIQRVGRTVEPLVEKRDQRLALDLPTVGVPTIADVGRVERALTNLLNNAMKFGEPQGEIRISLSHDGDVATISVSNDGPGFPEDERVFSPDRRADPARRTRRPGLGLLITQALVELHGGRIWIDREVRSGATIRFTMPLRATESEDEPDR